MDVKITLNNSKPFSEEYYNIDSQGNAALKNIIFYCPICYRIVLQPMISTYQVNKNCWHEGKIYIMQPAKRLK